MKIRPMGAEMFQADGRTEMTKLVLAFRSSATALIITGAWGSVVVKELRY